MPRKPLILCVDDEWNGLEGRKMLFEEAGCKVLVATSGAEALQLFASHPVDLVLLDYHMLGMNGDVVAEHMKAGEPDVPIALLSADDGLPESALKWVDAFVSKSESPEPAADCRAFARFAFSICSARWFNWRARKTRGIRLLRARDARNCDHFLKAIEGLWFLLCFYPPRCALKTM
jgi:CheY-like chemotaxis protein